MKRNPWKICLGIAGAMLLLMGAPLGYTFWSAHRRAGVVFEQHEREVIRIFAEIRARDTRRVPVGGEPIPGNGWELYKKALAAAAAIPESDLNVLPVFKDDPEEPVDLEKVDAVLELHAGVIEGLRLAGRAETLVPDYKLEDGHAMDLSNVTEAIRSAKVLVAVGTRRHEQGRDVEAVECFLRSLSLGHDTARQGPLVNGLVALVCEENGLEGFRKTLDGHSLPPPELERLARTLDGLASRRPTLAEAFQVEDATNRGEFFRSGSPLGALYINRGVLRSASLWRYSFSLRVLYADALNSLETFHREAIALQPLPHLQRDPRAKRLEENAAKSKNPIVLTLLPAVARTYRREATVMMRWNLLRTAVAIARYEAEKGAFPAKLEDLVPKYLPKLELCPFSGLPLGYSPGKVWSAGFDGIDDGGKPIPEDGPEEGPGDVVWTIKRK